MQDPPDDEQRVRVYPPLARRITAAREKAGLSRETVAQSIGLDLPSYWDLESYDDEAFMAVSIAELVSLARTLGVSARDLVAPAPAAADLEAISYAELSTLIRTRITLDGVSVDDWGERVGWDVSGILTKPESAAELCLDGLRDICDVLGVDWLAVVPA